MFRFFMTLAPALALAAMVVGDAAAGGVRDAGGQWRSGYLHEATGKLYVAVHDADELWVVDAASGDRLHRIALNAGPSAIAYDDATGTLAVANRMGESVSLVDRSREEVLATVPVGQGPVDVVALGPGRFAVAESFQDDVAVVGADGSLSRPFRGVPAVPTHLASVGGYLAVASPAASRIVLFRDSGGEAVRTLDLDHVPVFLAAAGDSALLVGGAGESTRISLDGGSVLRLPFSATSGAVAGGDLLLLGPEGLATFSASGERVSLVPLSVSAQRIVAAGAWQIALAPAQRQWQLVRGPVAGAPLEIQDAVPLEPTGPPEDVEEAEVIELAPVSEAAPPAPVLRAAAAPAVAGALAASSEPEKPKATDSGAPVTLDGQEETNEQAADEGEAVHGPEDVPQDTSVPADDAGEPALPKSSGVRTAPSPFATGTDGPAPSPGYQGGFRRHQMPTTSVRAPRAPLPEGPVSQDRLSRRSIRDAMIQPTEFGSPEAGFQAPDWDEPLRDIEADEMTRDFNVNRIDLTGNVRLRLGDMLFSAESFSYTEDLGLLEAFENVLIEQERSRLTADYLKYSLPEEPAPEDVPVMQPADETGLGAPRQLVLGRIEAEGLSIVEPTRRLEAEKVDYDFLARAGVFTEAKGEAGIFYWGAGELRILGPANVEGDEVWVTTCDHDPPHYRIRMNLAEFRGDEGVIGEGAQLELLGVNTPLYLPRYRDGGVGGKDWTLDIDTGRRAEIGSYLNVGQRYEVSREVALGPRLYATQKEGVGFGGDIDYDFTDTPSSRFYRTQGQGSVLYTTEDRGYAHWYHRWEHGNDLVLRSQLEHWGDADFYKDFYYDRFRNRTEPRTFTTLTYRQPTYIAEGVAKVGTHSFASETERLPEGAFHLLERPLAENLYFTFDTAAGYYRVRPRGEDAGRILSVARLSYAWAPLPALSVTPFLEAEGAFYTDLRDGTGSSGRITPLVGVTAQTRFHRAYPGRWGYSGFKHLVEPSITLSYRPESSLNFEEVPRFDAYDRVFGRTRIESKLSNILYARDAETGEVWQLARLTLYQGNDFWNEARKSDDYEIELDVRPRPWWGMQLVGEKHVQLDESGDDPARFFARRFRGAYEALTGRPYDINNPFAFNTAFGDYERILAQLYYDDTAVGGAWNGRVGVAYTATGGNVFNREILYGFGYRISEKWGLGFEHRYDFASKKLRSQTYEVRRTLHCWETAIRVRDRESGFDVDLEFNITAFPASRFKF